MMSVAPPAILPWQVRSEVESLVNELEAVRSTGLGALFGKFDAVAVRARAGRQTGPRTLLR